MTEEQRQLVAENHNLIYSFLIEYGFDQEEYYDLAAIGLCKAAMLWDSSRGAFSTYAYRAMLNMIKNEIKSKNVAKRIPEELIFSYNTECYGEDDDILDLIEAIPSDKDVEREIIDKVIFESCLGKMSDLSDRDRQVFWMLLDGYSLREIGRAVGCNHHNIAFVKRNIGRRLKDIRSKSC